MLLPGVYGTFFITAKQGFSAICKWQKLFKHQLIPHSAVSMMFLSVSEDMIESFLGRGCNLSVFALHKSLQTSSVFVHVALGECV